MSMKPSEALAEVKAAINILHFGSAAARAVIKAILDGEHDPVEKPVAAKPAGKVEKD